MKNKETTIRIRIGRGLFNDIVIDDESALTEHCKIVMDKDGCRVVNLKKDSKTFVNGKEVYWEAYLAQGDELRVGNIVVDWQQAVKAEIDEPNPKCPYCGSRRVRIKSKRNKWKFIGVYFGSAILLLLLFILLILQSDFLFDTGIANIFGILVIIIPIILGASLTKTIYCRCLNCGKEFDCPERYIPKEPFKKRMKNLLKKVRYYIPSVLPWIIFFFFVFLFLWSAINNYEILAIISLCLFVGYALFSFIRELVYRIKTDDWSGFLKPRLIRLVIILPVLIPTINRSHQEKHRYEYYQDNTKYEYADLYIANESGHDVTIRFISSDDDINPLKIVEISSGNQEKIGQGQFYSFPNKARTKRYKRINRFHNYLPFKDNVVGIAYDNSIKIIHQEDSLCNYIPEKHCIIDEDSWKKESPYHGAQISIESLNGKKETINGAYVYTITEDDYYYAKNNNAKLQ